MSSEGVTTNIYIALLPFNGGRSTLCIYFTLKSETKQEMARVYTLFKSVVVYRYTVISPYLKVFKELSIASLY